MERLFYLTACATMLLSSCGNTNRQEINLHEIEYNILRLDNGEGIFEDTVSYHYITKEDIRKAEKIFRQAIANYNKNSKDPLDHREYGRQYIGAETASGDILIYINCFKDPDEFSQKGLFRVEVSDGGDDYLHVMINVTAGELIFFGTNGWA
jgi:hypothetical protein